MSSVLRSAHELKLVRGKPISQSSDLPIIQFAALPLLAES
jgi:hypothetical protein